jgi:periplasmic divalent cation tolerance protein
VSTIRIVLSTFPGPDKAAEVARVLVEERLCACVNLVPAVRSIYRWQGAISDDSETLALIKTTADRVDALRARIAALHPYDVPEVLELDVANGAASYLAWVVESTRAS